MIGIARRVRLLMIPTLPPPRILAGARLLIALRILINVLLGHRPPGLHKGVVDANRSSQRGPFLGRCQVRGLVPRQGLAQAASRAPNSPEFIGRRRRLLVEIQLGARTGQTIITANPTTDGDDPAVVFAVIVVAVVVIVVPGAAGVAVIRVTTLLGALQTIVIFLGDVTTRRKTIAHIGATATLVARDRATATYDLVMIRLLSHLLQVLEGTEDFFVENVALLARVIGGTHVRRASHHRHPVHLFAHLDHNLLCEDTGGLNFHVGESRINRLLEYERFKKKEMFNRCKKDSHVWRI